MILNDAQIIERCRAGMISSDTFVPGQVRTRPDGNKALSYGVSSFGYDARLAPEYRMFRPRMGVLEKLMRRLSGKPWYVDPKDFDPSMCEDTVYAPYFDIPPRAFILGRSIEYFQIPRDVLAFCFGKSTYARCGLYINVTPLEPGWCGHVTLEIGNATNLPVRVYGNEGICQFAFLQGDDCQIAYGDRNGKYQYQQFITLPRV